MKPTQEIEKWENRQRQLKVLGLLSLSRQRRLESLPHWTWTFWEAPKHCRCDENGKWFFDCGWYVRSGEIRYYAFSLGDIWPNRVLTARELVEESELMGFLHHRWLKVEAVGWDSKSLQSAKAGLKTLVKTFQQFTVAELLDKWKKQLEADQQRNSTIYAQAKGQSKGRETLISKMRQTQTYLSYFDDVSEYIADHRWLKDVPTFQYAEPDAQAAFTAFMTFAHEVNAWKRKRTDEKPKKPPIDGTMAKQWAERRRRGPA